jgi:hypothetical protein
MRLFRQTSVPSQTRISLFSRATHVILRCTSNELDRFGRFASVLAIEPWESMSKMVSRGFGSERMPSMTILSANHPIHTDACERGAVSRAQVIGTRYTAKEPV